MIFKRFLDDNHISDPDLHAARLTLPIFTEKWSFYSYFMLKSSFFNGRKKHVYRKKVFIVPQAIYRNWDSNIRKSIVQ